jgi:FkbM family methyltransferase
MLRRRYEPEEAAYLAREAKGARLVLDIGANVGYFTRLFAEHVAPDGRVVAFEPNPEPFRYLVRNTRRFPNVLALPVGLAEKPGVFDLFTSEHDSATGSLSSNVVHQTMGSVARLRSVRVTLTRTEDLLAALGLDEPDLVKVDVEGWELNVFRSFGPRLARWQRTRFLFELNPAAMRGAGVSVSSLVDFWTQAGYRLFFLEAQGRTTPASGAEIEQRCAAAPGNCFYTSLVAQR